MCSDVCAWMCVCSESTITYEEMPFVICVFISCVGIRNGSNVYMCFNRTSLGIGFYILGEYRPIYHVIWHVCVTIAATLHWFAIYW